jgi:acylphosphatase
MKTYRIIVYGRVQGVGFRAFIHRQARNLNLNGSVKNLPDGTVQILLQGPDSDVKNLIELARTGPPLAQVSNIKIFEEDREPYIGFHIE